MWFKEQYGRELKTSTVSDYLGPKYAYLDNATLSKFKLASCRTCDPEYKELEDVLAEWQLRYDLHPDSGSTTGDLSDGQLKGHMDNRGRMVLID